MIIPKNLLFYINVGLSTKKEHPDCSISDKDAIIMAIELDNHLAYGMGKLERDRFLKSLGGMF